jgi:acyl-CoA thioesterase-1
MKAGTWILVALIVCGLTGAAPAKLVACVGDSITYGAGITDRMNFGYPAQLQRLLRQYDDSWEVRNFGVSGTTLLSRGDLPYIRQAAYHDAQACHPDLVIIKLGTNDSKPQNWQYQADFVADYSAMIDVFRALPSQPQVWICKPVPAYLVGYGITPAVIRDEILPLIEQIGREKDVPVIDLYTALLDAAELFPDGIHPNAAGAGMMARTVAACLLGVRLPPDFNGDWQVDMEDLLALIEHWGQAEPALDLAPVPFGDGVVDVNDLAALMAYWQWQLYDTTLLAHWALDEEEGTVAHDSTGGHDATFTGAPLWQPQGGWVGGAVLLDGLDDALLTEFDLNPQDSPLSVFAWVKGGAPGQVILSQKSGINWLMADSVTGALMTEFRGASRYSGALSSPTVIADDQWHHVGFVWDGATRTLYVDDVPVAQDTQSALVGGFGALRIGCGKSMVAGSFWSGLIDDVRIYCRVLREGDADPLPKGVERPQRHTSE